MSESQILWIELQDADATPVEFLRVGQFTDRHGAPVEVTEADLDAYAANFAEGAAGQDVPIDVEHERGKSHGWVKRVWRDGARLLADVNWNDLGRELIGGQVYRYLSATLDTVNKVLKAISLVNFPAVKGLAPVELSEGVYRLAVQPGLVDRIVGAVRVVLSQAVELESSAQESAQPKGQATMDENKEKEAELSEEQIREQVRAELTAELTRKDAELANLKAGIRAELEVELTAEFAERRTRENVLAEFAEEVCSGDHALSTPKDDVIAALTELTEEQQEPIKALLRAKVVDLSERGSSRDSDKTGKELPKRIVKELQAGTFKLADLSDPILGLGDLSQYDLSEFQATEG